MSRYTLTTTNKREFQQALKATDYLLALWDMDQWLRGQIKYEGKEYDEVREELHNILERHGIDLDDLE